MAEQTEQNVNSECGWRIYWVSWYDSYNSSVGLKLFPNKEAKKRNRRMLSPFIVKHPTYLPTRGFPSKNCGREPIPLLTLGGPELLKALLHYKLRKWMTSSSRMCPTSCPWRMNRSVPGTSPGWKLSRPARPSSVRQRGPSPPRRETEDRSLSLSSELNRWTLLECTE